MTIFSVAGHERSLTVRYIPIVAWGFGALAAYGIADIVARMVNGSLPIGVGSVGALLLLAGFAVFILYAGGQVVFASFDRASDQIRVRRYGLGGASTTERRLSDLTGIEIRVLRRAQHRVELRFTSGEQLPLTPYYVVSLNARGLRRLTTMLRIEPTITEPKREQGWR